jgi:Mg2+ and Co2+ transporter CorA
MSYEPETPFDNIEGALEYVNLLLESIQEAQEEIETDILDVRDSRPTRRKEALQLVSYKLDKLSTHLASGRRILNDLRTLRRLLLEERQAAK